MDYRKIKLIMVEATHHFNSNEYDQALNKYNDLISKYPESILAPTATFNIAVILMKKNSKAKALEQFENIISRFPNSESAKFAEMKIAEIKKIKKTVITL